VRRQALRGEDIFLTHAFLSAGECADFITQSEQRGYEEAALSTVVGPVVDKEVRDSARLLVDDVEAACHSARGTYGAWSCNGAGAGRVK
jgi:hypothetical protein